MEEGIDPLAIGVRDCNFVCYKRHRFSCSGKAVLFVVLGGEARPCASGWQVEKTIVGMPQKLLHGSGLSSSIPLPFTCQGCGCPDQTVWGNDVLCSLVIGAGGATKIKGGVAMQALGRQILIELYQCDPQVLNSEWRIREILVEATRRSGATIVSDTFHTFNPHGVSGVVVIAESHVSIHTWPEYGYAAVDVFTCGERIDPWVVAECLQRELRAQSSSAMELKRGLFREPVPHKPVITEEPSVP